MPLSAPEPVLVWAGFPVRWRTLNVAVIIYPLIAALGLVAFLEAMINGDGTRRVLGFIWLIPVVLGVIAAANLLRSRVMITADGIEVRELRTELYRWEHIVEVHPDRGNNRWVLRWETPAGAGVRLLPISRRAGLFRGHINPAYSRVPDLIREAWPRDAS